VSVVGESVGKARFSAFVTNVSKAEVGFPDMTDDILAMPWMFDALTRTATLAWSLFGASAACAKTGGLDDRVIKGIFVDDTEMKVHETDVHYGIAAYDGTAPGGHKVFRTLKFN
jgi:O-acetyl-ADP-ribose deacetylase (regulator of RNase III)